MLPYRRRAELVRVNSMELRRIGLDKNEDPPGVIGFRNHFTGVREPLCQTCLALVVVCGHLSPHLPVSEDCACRDRVPPGKVAEFVFEPNSTPGISYSDLVTDGGVAWNLGDWNLLVFMPIRRSDGLRRYDLMLPFVTMLQFLIYRSVDVPMGILTIVRRRFRLQDNYEILRFVWSGVGGAKSYVGKCLPEPAEDNLLVLVAEDCATRLGEYCAADDRGGF